MNNKIITTKKIKNKTISELLNSPTTLINKQITNTSSKSKICELLNHPSKSTDTQIIKNILIPNESK
jgi:hypothetical protein